MSRSRRSQTWLLSPANCKKLRPGWESTHLREAATTTVAANPTLDPSRWVAVEAVTTTVAASSTVGPHSCNSALPPISPAHSTRVSSETEDWNHHLTSAIERQPLPGGVRVVFPRTIDIGALGELAASEQACCQFFDFSLRITSDQVHLDVTGPADAQPVIASMFGVAA